jgi:hypothetical protein
MGEQPPHPRFSWDLKLALGLLASAINLGVLASVITLVVRGEHPNGSWIAVASATLVAATSFLILRCCQNEWWGVILALALPMHPWYGAWVRLYEPELRAEALALISLVCVMEGWRLTFRPHFAPRSWLLLALVVTACVGLSWPLLPQAGLVAGLLALIGLSLGAGLAARSRWESPLAPSAWNVGAAWVVGLLAPAGGLLLAPVAVDWCDWPGQAGTAADLLYTAIEPALEGPRLPGFTAVEIERWCWPDPAWVLLLLMAWGLWRTFRRGRQQWRRRQPPLAWVLTLYAVIALLGIALHPTATRVVVLLPLTILAYLLAVFGVADFVRGIAEQLVLAPPQERDQFV